MKKITYLLLFISIVLVFSGCKNQNENGISDPISDPGQYVQDMTALNQQMQENIQRATDRENERINNAINETNNSNNENNMDYVKNYTGAIIKTSLGNIQVKLNNNATPNAVNNFLKLADTKFYDGTKFHRVIKDFMIQGGDPLSKDATQKAYWGTGGPGYKFADELTGQETYPQGTLAMANSGPNTNGSQFFIVTASPSYPLPPNYTVFGQVVSGMDVALKIQAVKTDAKDCPLEDVVINSVELVK